MGSTARAGTESYYLEGPPSLVKGIYVGGDFGAMFFMGLQGPDFQDGPIIGVKLGTDIFTWNIFTAAAELTGHFTIHDSSFFSLSSSPPSFVMAMLDGKMKLGFHLMRRLVLNVFGGGGYLTSDPAFQYTQPRDRPYFLAGGGVEYYLHIRHLSAGFNPTVLFIDQLSGFALLATGTIKYTW